MSSPCDQVQDELAAIVDGDRDAIARHAEHLASCDACRDARHDAQQIAALVGAAGGEYAPTVDRLLAALDTPAPSDTLVGVAPVAGVPVAAAPVVAAAPAQPAYSPQPLAAPAKPAKPAPAKQPQRT